MNTYTTEINDWKEKGYTVIKNLFNKEIIQKCVCLLNEKFNNINSTNNDFGSNGELEFPSGKIIDQITKSIYVPITIGGGINTLDQAKKMFNSGADKITLNSFAVQNPKLITEIANNFGSQAVTLSLQIKRKDNIYNVMTHNGREKSNKKLENWIKEAIERGIGEIMITSIDKEGTLSGFDIELLQLIRSITDLPIICSGGIASLSHVIQCFEKGSQAVAIASALHYKKLSLSKLKSDLLKNGIKVRH